MWKGAVESYQVSDHILVHSNLLKVFWGEDLSWGSPKIQPETEPVRRVCVSRMSWRPPSQIAADLGSEVSLCMHSGTKSRMRSWQPLDFGWLVFFFVFFYWKKLPQPRCVSRIDPKKRLFRDEMFWGRSPRWMWIWQKSWSVKILWSYIIHWDFEIWCPEVCNAILLGDGC